MKLELGHLTPYLPFELKIKSGKNVVRELSEMSKAYDLPRKYTHLYNVINGIGHRPILRPLDTLKKEITHNGKTFIPLHELLKDNCFNLEEMIDERINEFEQTFMDAYTWSYKDVITLCSWHYDIFNLIEKGLAINLNKI